MISKFERFDKYVKPLESALWKLPAFKITTGNDTEYVQRPNRSNLMLTTQKAFSEKDVLVFEHPSLGLNLAPTWNSKVLLSTALGLKEVSAQKPDGYLVEDMMGFFAPADFLAGQFTDRAMIRYIQKFMKQDARITLDTKEKANSNLLKLPIYLETSEGILQYVLAVSDLAKLLGAASLKQTADTFGVAMSAKNLMDDYKTNMLEPYRSTEAFYCNLEDRSEVSLHNLFMEYSKEDASVLFPIRANAQNRTKMLYDVHDLAIPSKEYLTTGALVSSLGIAYMEQQIGESKPYERFQKRDAKGKAHSYKLEDLLNKASVDYFAKKEGNSKQVLALVQGGRAKNERPTVVRLEGAIADNDFDSAYVTLQRLLVYPIGFPRVYNQHESSNRKVTLGQFRKKHDKHLAPRLYVIVVSGTLDHHQNLVSSKVVETFDIAEKYNEDNPNIPADFRLYAKEIVNGIITSDVMEALENVTTNKEWSSWMNLEVKSAIWYSPSDRVDTAEEWDNRIRQCEKEYGNAVHEEIDAETGYTDRKDRLCRAWFAAQLNDYLSPYANKRKELKNAMKATEDDKVKTLLNAQQTAMKLVGNVNYGAMASPLLPIGNVLMSNVITAACRVAVWAHDMAMGGYQGITDGAAYDLNNVRYWKGKKPGMNTLALWRNDERLNRLTQKGLKTAPLGGKTWTIEKSSKGESWSKLSNGSVTFELAEDKDGFEELNQMVKEHIIDFFRCPRRGNGFSLLESINFEHKNVYVAAAFQSQTNYLFKHVSGKTKIKARGHKTKGKRYNNDTEQSNMSQLLEDLLDNPHKIPPYKPQTISQVLKVNQANKLSNSSKENAVKKFDMAAGDSILKRSWVRPISLSMFHWMTDEQYESWYKKAEFLKTQSGWGVEQFFLDEDGYLDYQRAVIEIQAAIDDGKTWLYPVAKGKKVEPIAKHPYFDMAEKLASDFLAVDEDFLEDE